MKRILIAGIGNIFLGDDGFGCEVIRELRRRELPEGVEAVDFGIRSYDLAMALTRDYEIIILVDIAPRGEAPGTAFLLEIDPNELPQGEQVTPDGHRLDAMSALQMAPSFGGIHAKIYLAGCEPAVLESDEIGLSAVAQSAVPQAIELIEALLHTFTETTTPTKAGLMPV